MECKGLYIHIGESFKIKFVLPLTLFHRGSKIYLH
uniref:Uncharacterized protein n=1 Tax=Anguilla anguilla TaxID=7936 RepID=A0A0E9TJ02_ANGAN